MSKTVSFDARKIIKYINESAQSDVYVVSKLVRRMGDKLGRNYQLVALHDKNLMFEDCDNGAYYIADYKPLRGNRINVSNIARVQVRESKKGHIFQNACNELVDALCEGDTKGAESAFRKLEGCKFRPTAASSDGFIVTRDGRRRHINTGLVSEDAVSNAASILSNLLSENVIVENDEVVGASVGDFDFRIDRAAQRRHVANKMKCVAESAHKSPGFQSMARKVAGLVSKNQLEDAVVESAKFFREYQEFCLLNRDEMRTLAENALAANNVYNHVLAENVGTLFFKTNLRVNKASILEAWEKTAKVAASSTILEDVKTLSKSSSFESDYNDFLNSVLVEGAQEDREMLAKTVGLLLNVLNKEIEEFEGSGVVSDTAEAINSALKEDVDSAETPRALQDLIKARDAVQEIYDAVAAPTADTESIQKASDLVHAIDIGAIDSSVDMDSFDLVGEPDPDLDMAGIDELADEEEGEVAPPEGEEGEAGGVGGAPGLDLGFEEGEADMDLGDMDIEGEEGLEAPEGEEGEEELGAPEDEDEEDEEDLASLLAASKETPVEEMGLELLKENLFDWQKNVAARISEQGGDVVFETLNAFATRAHSVGATDIAESFVNLMPQKDDSYAEFVTDSDVEIDLDYGLSEGAEPNEPAGSDVREWQIADEKGDDEEDDTKEGEEQVQTEGAEPNEPAGSDAREWQITDEKGDDEEDDTKEDEEQAQDGDSVTEATLDDAQNPEIAELVSNLDEILGGNVVNEEDAGAVDGSGEVAGEVKDGTEKVQAAAGAVDDPGESDSHPEGDSVVDENPGKIEGGNEGDPAKDGKEEGKVMESKAKKPTFGKGPFKK